MNILLSTKVNDRKEAFVLKLKALYDIERELVEALPKLEEAAHDPELKEGFRNHLGETHGHIRRLEQAFKTLGEEADTERSSGIRGIIASGEWVAKDVEAPDAIKDALLASAARYAEHYEISGYLGAIMEAELLGYMEIAADLLETLDEERAADGKLAEAARKNFGAE